jgi:hypothetical protein
MKSYLKVLLGVILLLAIVAIGAGIYLYTLKPQDLSKARPDYVITSSDLLDEFESDEASASAKYINKILEVTGEIISVEETGTGSWNISLQTRSDFSKVICTFPSVETPSVFETGNIITLRGECSGFLMDVLLNNCNVIR